MAALATVGAMALSGGEVDQIEASTPSPGLVTTPGTSTLNGYWNPYTLEWVPFETIGTASVEDGYWNPYTLEWVPFETIGTTSVEDGYWNPYTLEWVPFDD